MSIVGSLIIISAPSGTGKTSLVSSVCRELPNLQKSISHTTRDKRVGEKDGQHYHFVNKDQFNDMMAKGTFLEHAEVFGNLYGTSRDWVTATTQRGTDVILEIDWQGAQQIRKKMPDVVSIFILPPSDTVLRQRLIGRNQDDAQKIIQRLAQAKTEVSHYNEYDYLIVNDDFELALQQLIAVISSVRLRVARQAKVCQQLITQLCDKA
jgi:guanylate kinase